MSTLVKFLLFGLGGVSLIVGIVALFAPWNITSPMIQDGTIKEVDLSDELKAGLKESVLGVDTVTSADITDGTIQPADLGFNVVSSINNIVNNGGNIAILGGNNIGVTNDSVGHSVTLNVLDGSGSGLDADKLDGLDSSEFVHVVGDTMTGKLTIANGGLDVNDLARFFNDVEVWGGTFLKGTLDVLGVATFHSDVFADCYKITSPSTTQYCDSALIDGTLTVNDETTLNDLTTINANLVVNGDTYANGDLDVRDTTYLGTTQTDPVYVRGFLNNPSLIRPLTVRDDRGFLVTDYSDSDISFRIFGNGEARFYGDAIPNQNDAYDLGSWFRRWSNLYVNDEISIGVPFSDRIIITNDEITKRGGDDLVIKTELGAEDINLIPQTGIVNASADLLPATTNTYDLGSASLRWANLFVNNLDTAGSLTVGTVFAADPAGNALGTGKEVAVQGDLYVSGVIDPLAIILTPNVDGAKAVDVKNTSNNTVFFVTENGDVSENRVAVGGGYNDVSDGGTSIDDQGNISTNGNITVDGEIKATDGTLWINAQLTVNELIVSGKSTLTGHIKSDLIPDAAGQDLGENTVAGRWENLFAKNVDLTGTLDVDGATQLANTKITGILALPSYPDVKSTLDGFAATLGSHTTSINTLNTKVANLEARKLAAGGTELGCNGSRTLISPITTCSFSVSGATSLDGVSLTPMINGGTGNASVMITSIVGNTVNMRVSLEGIINTTVTGVSWTAVYSAP